MFSTVNILRSDLDKMEHFYLRWGEVRRSCQDGVGVAGARWRFEGVTKLCVCVI